MVERFDPEKIKKIVAGDEEACDSVKNSLEFKEGQEVLLPAGAEFYISQLEPYGHIKTDSPVKVEIIAQDYGQINVRVLEDIGNQKTKNTYGWVQKHSINPDVEF